LEFRSNAKNATCSGVSQFGPNLMVVIIHTSATMALTKFLGPSL